MDISEQAQAVIFDLDGVLVDSVICHFNSWKVIADRLGLDFNKNKNDRLRGISRRDSLMIILEDTLTLPESDILNLLKEKSEIYKQMVQEAGEKLILPGAVEFIRNLKHAGFKLAIASSSKNARYLLNKTTIGEHHFDAIIDGNDTTKTKPDPEIFLLAAVALQVRPEKCLVIEDAPAGIEGAQKAGMGTIGIGSLVSDVCDIHYDSIGLAKCETICAYFSKQ